jgi:hypothetical protein
VSCCVCTLNALEPFSLEYFVGDTVGIAASVTLDGVAYNLTGCALTFLVTDPSVTPAVTIWNRAIGQGIAILSLSGGTALITPTPAESQAMTVGKTYAGRAVLTDSAGAIITTATGYILAR